MNIFKTMSLRFELGVREENVCGGSLTGISSLKITSRLKNVTLKVQLQRLFDCWNSRWSSRAQHTHRGMDHVLLSSPSHTLCESSFSILVSGLSPTSCFILPELLTLFMVSVLVIKASASKTKTKAAESRFADFRLNVFYLSVTK